jgi:hypothetical protein
MTAFFCNVDVLKSSLFQLNDAQCSLRALVLLAFNFCSAQYNTALKVQQKISAVQLYCIQ